MSGFRKFLMHVCVICGFICIITRVLDWCNPYMDFYGHVFWTQDIIYVGILLLSVTKMN